LTGLEIQEDAVAGELQKFMDTLLTTLDDSSSQVPADQMSYQAQQFSFSMVQFRYSRTEITGQGSHAHVRHSETRYENDRLVKEECEGTVDGAAYERMVEQHQKMFAAQVGQMMRFWSLPFGGWRK
jgi:hypothetical protein